MSDLKEATLRVLELVPPDWRKEAGERLIAMVQAAAPDMLAMVQAAAPDMLAIELAAAHAESARLRLELSKLEVVPRRDTISPAGRFLVRARSDGSVDIFVNVQGVAGDWWCTVQGQPGVDREKRAMLIAEACERRVP